MAHVFTAESILLGSGLLTATGNALYVNGAGMGGGDVTSAQLTSTGVQLGAKIDSVSGWAASAANLTATGATLISLISAASAGVSSLNGASGVLTLQGAGSVLVTTDGQTITASGSRADAIALSGQLGLLSGYADTTFATKGSLAATGQQAYLAALNNGLNLSGALAASGAVLGARIDTVTANLTLTGQTLDARVTTVATNLTATGVTLQARINSLSGWAASAVNLTATGQTLDARINTLAANLALTGTANWIYTSGLSGNLAATGSNLQGQINALTTNLTNTGVTLGARIDSVVANLTATGVTLGAKVDFVSGWAASAVNLGATGSTLDGQIAAVASNLTVTGVVLWQRDLDISGVLQAQIGAAGGVTSVTGIESQIYARANAGNVTLSLATGLTGIASILAPLGSDFTIGVSTNLKGLNVGNSLVGSMVFRNANGDINYDNALLYSATNNLLGLGNATHYWSQLYATNVNAVNVAAGGTGTIGFLYLGATGDYTPSGAASVAQLIGASGALAAQIAGGGTQVQITGSSTLGTANFTGIGGTIVYMDGGIVYVSGGAGGGGDVTAAQLTSTGVQLGARIDAVAANLQSTGQALYGLLTAASGQFDTNYATKLNLALTGQSLYVLTTGLSGQHNTDFATKTNVTLTGQALGARIDTVTTNLTLTGQTLGAKVDSVSGWAASAVNLTATGAGLIARDITVSGALNTTIAATGSNLYALVTGLSGQHNTDFATKVNLALTGSNLYVLTTGLSGQAVSTYATIANLASTGQQAWGAASNNALNISGNLAATGATLIARDLAISGVLASQIQASAAGVSTLNGVSGTLTLTLEKTVGAAGSISVSGQNLIISGVSQMKLRENFTVNQTYDGITMNKVYGETIGFGDAVYFKNDGKVWKASASGVATAPGQGLAVSAGAANATGSILILGTVRNSSWNWNITGGMVYLWSGAAGQMSQIQPSGADQVIHVMGFAHPDSGTMFVKPSSDYISRT